MSDDSTPSRSHAPYSVQPNLEKPSDSHAAVTAAEANDPAQEIPAFEEAAAGQSAILAASNDDARERRLDKDDDRPAGTVDKDAADDQAQDPEKHAQQAAQEVDVEHVEGEKNFLS